MKMYIKNIKNIVFCIILFVTITGIVSCGAAEAEKEDDEIDFEEYFAHYDEMLGFGYERISTSYASYDIREMELQIDGFWDYYERYEKARQDLDKTIAEWETDFIGEGTYVVGQDIPSGQYVFCNPNGDSNDEENAISTTNKINTSYTDIFMSRHFDIVMLKEDDVLKVKGSPKLALLDEFPAFSVSEDGNYYGRYYKVGENIPEGMYLFLSMDIEEGKVSCFEMGRQLHSFILGVPETRFSYEILIDEEKNDVILEGGILIPLEHKPVINPIPHEDITYKNKKTTVSDLVAAIAGMESERERSNYSQPVYVEGDYIVGEDLPLGTYQIQCEIAYAISDRDSEEYQSDNISIYSGNNDYCWSGLVLPYQDMAEQCGWKYIRLGIWEAGKQRVGVRDPEGKMSGYTVYEGDLPSITFAEKDKGIVVSVIRAILIPQQAG